MSKELIESKYLKKRERFNVGDTVKVYVKIFEGKKERIQSFLGIVIAKKGKGISETFTVYRNAYGSSMERVFLLNSPQITKIEVQKLGKVKKAKLYHLRGEKGKKAKIKEKLSFAKKDVIKEQQESEIK
ncbi:MAG: hypothetical protein AMS24_01980 [Chlamydiae bacterium SM23_39]|nr:MAG: hypothetical protein AMS24_01980 [Chlamydiae bacterium SM23_39]